MVITMNTYEQQLKIKTQKTHSAFLFASYHHKNQIRKFSGELYIVHPITVANIISDFQIKNLEKFIIVALVHDVLEDSPYCCPEEIQKQFGLQVTKLVLELTNDKEQIAILGKTEYMKQKFISLSNQALLLKLSDRLANMLDNPTDKMKLETLEIMLFLKENRKLTFYQEMLYNKIIEIVQ